MMNLKRRQKIPQLSSRASSDDDDESISSPQLPMTATTVSSKNTPKAGSLTRALIPSHRKQVLFRKAFFSVLLFVSAVLVLQLFVYSLKSDQEPPYYTITSSPTPTEQMLQEWQKHGEQPAVIHVLHTRFMQHQGNLTALAQARLLLFQVFCLPTIVHQSTQHFIWMIKVDPDLDRNILRQLVALVEPYDNIFLVASQVNFLVNPNVTGAWRETEIRQIQQGSLHDYPSAATDAGDLHNPSHVYSGSRRLLAVAMALSNQLLVVETRLDADDGLHHKYLQYVQEHAVQHFQQHPAAQYKYWCSRLSLEWHWELQKEQSQKDNAASHGMLQIMRHSNMCITPGLTVAYAAGVEESRVPVMEHHKLMGTLIDVASHPNIPDCGADPCIEFVSGKFAFDSIRSRTPTSTGMLDILRNNATAAVLQHQSTPSMQYNFWAALHSSFFIARDQVRYAQGYMQGHRLYEIARENLAGQCQSLHSCKETAKQDLQKILKMVTP